MDSCTYQWSCLHPTPPPASPQDIVISQTLQVHGGDFVSLISLSVEIKNTLCPRDRGFDHFESANSHILGGEPRREGSGKDLIGGF